METLSSVYAPFIGANGNWYVDNEDTGVKAQGSAGPQGPVGVSGAQGLIGPKGETGDRGPQGIQGPVGATGAQGEKGEKGDVGPQGPKGDTPELAADLLTTVAGKALDATMGKVLDDKIKANKGSIDTINLELNQYQYIIPYTAEMGSIVDMRMDMKSGISKNVGCYSSILRPSDFPTDALGTTVYAMISIKTYANISFIDITNVMSSGKPNHISGYYAAHLGLIWGDVY